MHFGLNISIKFQGIQIILLIIRIDHWRLSITRFPSPNSIKELIIKHIYLA